MSGFLGRDYEVSEIEFWPYRCPECQARLDAGAVSDGEVLWCPYCRVEYDLVEEYDWEN